MRKIILTIILLVIPLVCFAQKIKENTENNLVEIKAVLEMPLSSWSPYFEEECISPLPLIKASGKTYYLLNTCSLLSAYEDILGKEVIIKGIIEERKINVPLRKELNPPTKEEIFTFIDVKQIELVE